MAQIDLLTEKILRRFAGRTSRRSVFSVLGGFLAGAAALPLLPVARAEGPEPNGADPNSGVPAPRNSGNPQDPGDASKCDYWRYCAIDGSLCSCYGGTVTSCPPGTEMSPITWIGTCSNPADKRNYIISYNDCCGGVAWGRCACKNKIKAIDFLFHRKSSLTNSKELSGLPLLTLLELCLHFLYGILVLLVKFRVVEQFLDFYVAGFFQGIQF